MNTLQRLSPRLLLIGLGLEVLVLLASYIESGGEVNTFFQSAARLSGRVSLLFFAMAFVYATLKPAFERGTETFQVKFRLYRDFAILHLIHLCLLAASVYHNDFDIVFSRLLAGMLAYVLVVNMPTWMHMNRWDGKVLARLQGIYLFWVWFVFFMTYVTRLRGQSPGSSGSPSGWWPLAIFTLGLMAWRLWKIWERRLTPTSQG